LAKEAVEGEGREFPGTRQEVALHPAFVPTELRIIPWRLVDVRGLESIREKLETMLSSK